VGSALASISYARSVEVADLNNDGFLDVAVASQTPDGITVFLNDGTGNMTAAGFASGVDTEGPFVLADLNGDGLIDLAAVDNTYSYVLVFPGNGDGTFQAPRSYLLAAGLLLGGVIAGDFDGNGKLDLVAPWNQPGSNSFSFLPGNGDGTFGLPQVHAGPTSAGLSAADFNGDGQLDLVAISATDGIQRLAPLLQTSVLAIPSGVSFQPVTVTLTGQPVSVALSNIATTPLHISGLNLTGTDPTQFSLASDACSGQTIEPGVHCSFSVEFRPTSTGVQAATVTVTDSARVQPQSVVLEGSAGGLEVTPTSVAFGTVQVHHASGGEIVTITNLASAADQIQISEGGADPQDFLDEVSCVSPIQPGVSCSLFLHFIPTETGVRSATISVADTLGNVTLTVSLTGTGAS
jgi:hypothetical protein